MLTENTGKTSAKISTANNNGTCADGPRVMDTEAISRGIRATEIGIAALERLFRRDMDRIRTGLAELQRSIELGEPTEYVARFGVAREIEDGANHHPLACKLAGDVLYSDYYQHALELTLWPLLCIASGIEGDGIASHIRMWCHGGAIDLDEETERQMFEAAGLHYTPSRVVRCFSDVTAEDDEDESRRAG